MITSLEPAIVRIRTTYGDVVGAGFLVTKQQVLTCAHVVSEALGLVGDKVLQPTDTVHLDFPLIAPGQALTGRITLWQAEADIAGLQLEEALPTEAQSLPLVESSQLWGHSFRAFGFPAGYDDGVWALGELRGRQAAGWVQIEDIKQTGYFVQPGFSGGPVWDNELNGVAGMIVAADTNENVRTAFIIPTDVLINSWPILKQQSILPCPYRGLSAFREQDALFFFGREIFIKKLVEAVQQQPLTAVLGASGSGKSSIVFAGLVSELRPQRNWIIAHLRPGSDPFRALATALLPLYEIDLDRTDQLVRIPKLANYLREGALSLSDIANNIIQTQANVDRHQQSLPALSSASLPRLLLVIDQFEELYTLSTDVQIHHRFLDILLDTLQQIQPSLHFLFTLRADFLGQVLSHRPLADALQNADLKLGPMSHQELELVIENPAKKLGVAFEAGLVKRILDDVGQEPGNLPLLEFALTLLWERQNYGWLTHQAYEAIGRAKGALTHYADAVYNNLSPAEQERTRRVFVQLVRPGEGTEDTRRVAMQSELEVNWSLVQYLATARLVVTNQNAEGLETAEIVHEALIQGWSRLRQWMTTDRTFRTWQERLRGALRQWQTTGKDGGALLRGVLLAEAEGWLTERERDLSSQEVEFIKSSLLARTQEQEELKRVEIAEAKSKWLSEMMITLNSTLNYRKVLRSVIDLAFSAMIKTMDADDLSVGGMILLFAEDGDDLVVAAGRNLAHSDEGRHIDSNQGLIGKAIRTAEAIVTNNIRDDTTLRLLPTVSQFAFFSAVCIPLRSGFNTYGVLLFFSTKPEFFNEEYKNILITLSNQAIVALQNAQLFEDFHKEQRRNLEQQAIVQQQLARDIHDGALGALAAIVMRLNLVRLMIQRDKNYDRGLEEIKKIEEIAVRVTNKIRTILLTMHPIIVQSKGLVPALNQYVENLNQNSNLIVTMINNDYEGQLKTEIEGVIYTIIEEAVENTRKYSNPSQLTIILTVKDEYLLVEIQGNGTVFDAETAQSTGDQSINLEFFNIRERAELVAGKVSIESMQEMGTMIRIHLPFSQNPEVRASTKH